MIQLQQIISGFSTYIKTRVHLHFTQNSLLVPAGEMPHIYPSFFAGRQLYHYETINVISPGCRYLTGF